MSSGRCLPSLENGSCVCNVHIATLHGAGLGHRITQAVMPLACFSVLGHHLRLPFFGSVHRIVACACSAPWHSD